MLSIPFSLFLIYYYYSVQQEQKQNISSSCQFSWQAPGQSEIKIIASVRETHASPLCLLYHSLRYKSTNIIPRRFLFQSLIRHIPTRPGQTSPVWALVPRHISLQMVCDRLRGRPEEEEPLVWGLIAVGTQL